MGITTASPRREFLMAGGCAALTSSMRGANDKLTIAHIGTGTMGRGNIGYAAKSGFQITALCDVYQPNLERAQALARKLGQEPRLVKDFREIIADKSIDVVCISTPDHWHAYMTIEACKAGKDVYVEKPSCVYVEEGLKMVEAARKYKRVVQGGTMQRSGYFFKKAVEIVKSGDLGEVTFCRTWQAGMTKKDGYGFPGETQPPAGLDWDLWLGPAPKRAFNINRWGIVDGRWSTFRYFWDYAGGAMTDWNVHLLDIVQYAYDEVVPLKYSALGSKFYVNDDTETPDTLVATYHYPKFLCMYESRTAAPEPMFGEGYGTAFLGTKGTLVVNRGGYKIVPAGKSALQPFEDHDKAKGVMNELHWENFVECVKTRQRPIAEIETTVRTTIACLLSNIALRADMTLDWDDNAKTVKQEAARKHLKAQYRKPWKLEV
ncbi:MAG: Gfo/Idh/MocA family oxidoreductase [Acidobacteria bacterium]|nr:Gfo/Idh/MocA family oxidoreductase [Acidobacteriota bacterium]